jgi:hypothetical protein
VLYVPTCRTVTVNFRLPCCNVTVNVEFHHGEYRITRRVLVQQVINLNDIFVT